MTWALLVLAANTVALVVLERVLLPPGPVPLGAFAVVGVIGCLVIVAVAKLIGKRWLQRPESWDD
jgi:hypothetical protein